ncbi:family 78 glycoside hydrolase catalytic domain [Microbacterium aurum]
MIVDARISRILVDAPYGSDYVASAQPIIGWMTEAASTGWRQARAELELTSRGNTHSAVIEGSASNQIPWPFPALASRDEAKLRVRVTGVDDAVSEWSAPRIIRAAFLAEGEWRAATIALAAPQKHAEPAYLRTEFDVSGTVARATLYATAVGVYQVAINGTDVDDQVMKPGWTPFHTRTVHETTDVTSLIGTGRAALGVRLAGAWATESFGFRESAAPVYGDQPRFAAQLVIEYADGSSETIVTDAAWQASPGPITASGLYGGESFDARRVLVDDEGRGFAEPGFDGGAWAPVDVVESIPVPGARISPFVRRIEEISVREVITTPSGRTVLDFGQNLVGRLRIRVAGPAGTVVTLRHAEVLEHGELGVRPLRAAKATDTYTLAGGATEEWEPEFTFHGFRYAEVDGWPGELDPADITAIVIHSDMERTGWFESSNELVNRLHENVVWGLRGNFLSVPTDCPQRDERLGWTGDIEVFAPTASFLYDVRGFLDSWLIDLAIEQEEGVVPFVVPNVLGPAQAAAAWGDAATVIPWVLNERYGDVATVERQYPSMKGWADVLIGYAGERRLWEGMFQFGDWLDPDAPPESPAKAKTDGDIVASAYLFVSVRAVARAAALLGLDADAEHYGDVTEEVRRAFLNEYITPSGRLVSDAQTAYAMAIVFEIAPAEQLPALGARLAELARRSGYRIGTGFVGTPIIQDALTRTGHLGIATRLLTQTENPSWLYPVTMGATTIWERWDSMLPDGTINPGEMTSFNHYALGAIADWLHRVVAGLAPAAPGYERIRVAPRPLPGFDRAEASHVTPYGLARVSWERTSAGIRVEAVIPANTTAVVDLPDGSHDDVGSGSHSWTVDEGEPVVAPGSVGLETSLAVLIDDREAYAALLEAVDSVNPDATAAVRSEAWVAHRTVGDMLFIHGGPLVRAAVEERLEELSASRFSV